MGPALGVASTLCGVDSQGRGCTSEIALPRVLKSRLLGRRLKLFKIKITFRQNLAFRYPLT